MVHQEIRHSNFLGYILDPARPHGFSDLLLRELIDLLLEETDDSNLNRLALHFRPLGNARVYRERHSIDLLIDIPAQSNDRGLVIALELKVNAAEGNQQLARYEESVKTTYRGADHLFGFLTTEGRDGETSGAAHWVPLDYTTLLERFENRVKQQGIEGRGAEMLADYARMMRRHGMADGAANKALDEAVSKIWAAHREALDYLMDNRPDALGDAMKAFLSDESRTKTADFLSAVCGDVIKPDSSSGRYHRFCFKTLLETYSELKDAESTWVESQSLVLLELHHDRARGEVQLSIVVGKATNNLEFRSALIEELSKKAPGRRRKTTSNNYKHFWKKTLVEDETQLLDAEDDRAPEDVLADLIATELKLIYPELKAAIEAAHKATAPAPQ